MSGPPLIVTAVLDLALVLLFAAIGQSSHDEAGGATGILRIAWPFLAGAALGWALTFALRRRHPDAPIGGVVVWVTALVGGMLLRLLTGAGTAFTFIVVAALTLGLFLVGWRIGWSLAASWVTRRRTRGTTDTVRPVAKT